MELNVADLMADPEALALHDCLPLRSRSFRFVRRTGHGRFSVQDRQNGAGEFKVELISCGIDKGQRIEGIRPVVSHHIVEGCSLSPDCLELVHSIRGLEAVVAELPRALNSARLRQSSVVWEHPVFRPPCKIAVPQT